jgi:hypothetical protein
VILDLSGKEADALPAIRRLPIWPPAPSCALVWIGNVHDSIARIP